MDLQDLTPAGSGTLSGPVAPPSRQYAATFVHTGGTYTHPDEIWSPRGSEIAPPGRPLPAIGYGLEHEPVDGAERTAEHTAQDAGDFHTVAGRVRAAVRPGSVMG